MRGLPGHCWLSRLIAVAAGILVMSLCLDIRRRRTEQKTVVHDSGVG